MRVRIARSLARAVLAVARLSAASVCACSRDGVGCGADHASLHKATHALAHGLAWLSIRSSSQPVSQLAPCCDLLLVLRLAGCLLVVCWLLATCCLVLNLCAVFRERTRCPLAERARIVSADLRTCASESLYPPSFL